MKTRKIIIGLLIFIGLVIILFFGLTYWKLSRLILLEDFKTEQLVNGRYYYLKTKVISISNLEHKFINNIYKQAYLDKYFKQENIQEKWEDLSTINYLQNGDFKQHDLRGRTTNQEGVVTFDKAFIQGNYFTCLDCHNFTSIEEEINEKLPINDQLVDILSQLNSDPWKGREFSQNNQVNLLFELQINHNDQARKKIFNLLRYNFWDEIDYLGKITWQGKLVYGFQFIDKNFSTVHIMYFDSEKIKYVGEEKISKTYAGDSLTDLINIKTIIVLEEIYSDINLGVNSDGLIRESVGEINQFLNQTCLVDIDCEGITGYTIEPGSCPTYLNRCIDGECALMCRHPRQPRNTYCSKYNQEIKAFINYTCFENEQGTSRLVKEEDNNYGICRVEYSEEKKIIFYQCVDNEQGDIELLEELN